MLDVKEKPSLAFPDNPLKWEGWSNYNAENLYDRLCLDPRAKPDDEQIQQHCTALIRWWHKKLPLKNQPSNPLAQLLGRGIDEASGYLVQARMQLLDPVRRRQVDAELAAQAQQEALDEFCKYVAVSIVGKVLTAEAEANLSEFGQRNGLTEEQTFTCIEQELQRNKAHRAAPSPPAPPETIPDTTSADGEKEFQRILKLSDLNSGDATEPVREIFVTIAENLGIELPRAEHLLGDYLAQEESVPADESPPRTSDSCMQPAAAKAIPAAPAKTSPPAEHVQTAAVKLKTTRSAAGFANPTGARMILIPAGGFMMGSNAADAGSDEQPLTPTTLSEFYISRHPVTNAQYEQFDPSHKQKRIGWAGDDHPVVYVNSLDAIKYCQWLRQKDGNNYRLPTEAEWEYAARGTDGRKYPWGNEGRRGAFANFADASTTFPWRDLEVNDGYPETSPVGAFPRGASFFGVEDMAGNVWEWCHDFYRPLPGAPQQNPRGSGSGDKRVYRGGSWKSRFANLRATARSSNAPIYSCNDVGFRVACECGGDPHGKTERNAV